MSEHSVYTVMCPGESFTYSEATNSITSAIYNFQWKWIEEAINIIHLDQCEPFVIVNYGAGDGGSSTKLICQIIEYIQNKHGHEQEVYIVYDDQSENNFNALVHTYNSRFTGYNNVYVTICGTSFCSQCIPKNSVHIGISSTAMQWLSKRPCHLTDTISHVLSENYTEKAMFAKQASNEWEQILLCRAKELKHGGHLVLSFLCIDENGQYSHRKNHETDPVDQILETIWRNMMTEGLITKQEFNNATFCWYYRSPSEIKAPFIDAGSSVHKAGLRLLHFETETFSTSINKEFKSIEVIESKQAAKDRGHRNALNTRAWSECTFLTALDDKRNYEEKKSIVGELYHRLALFITDIKEDYICDLVSAFVHIHKMNDKYSKD